jgi:hypothetical protein
VVKFTIVSGRQKSPETAISKWSILPQWSILHRPAFSIRLTVRGRIKPLTHKAVTRLRRAVMKAEADYRKLAEDCVQLAQTAAEVHRFMLLNMAHTWLQFADRAARDHERIVNGHARAAIGIHEGVFEPG